MDANDRYEGEEEQLERLEGLVDELAEEVRKLQDLRDQLTQENKHNAIH